MDGNKGRAGRAYPDVEVEVTVCHRPRKWKGESVCGLSFKETYSTLNPIVGIVVTTSPICASASDKIPGGQVRISSDVQPLTYTEVWSFPHCPIHPNLSCDS